MKKTLIAIASIAAMGAASAGPTVYGVVDVNVASTSGGGTAAAPVASQTTIGDNGYSTSRFGVKGDMDLGGGLKGIYQYETGVPITSPGAITWGNRGAYAGVTGAFGTVTVGRSFTPFAISLFNDAMEYDNLSAYWTIADQIGVHSDNVWQNKAISYASPSLNGLTVNAMVSPGGDATATTGASNYTGLGATYGLGALNLTAGWESNKTGSTGATVTASNVGFAYGFGVATVSAAFQKADNGASQQDSGWIVSTSVPLSGKYALQAGYASMTTNGTVNVNGREANAAGGVTLTSTNLVVVNDLTASARAYAGVYTVTDTARANSNGAKFGVRYSF